MSWRTVFISEARKLSLNLNSLQVFKDEEKYYINLDEIAILVIEDNKSIITTRLLIELAEKGIPVLILGNNKMPIGEYQPIFNNVRVSKRIYEQMRWDDKLKEKLWSKIIEFKILNQINTLVKLDKNDKIEVLKNNVENIRLGDSTNMEGISARVYFKALFGEKFIRFDTDIINVCLDFSYHLVRTIISKELISRGYITVIGINHKSQYNQFNLSDDIIEVFRPIVDYYVFNILLDNKEEIITKEIKIKLLEILNQKVMFDDKKYTLVNSVSQYVNCVINYINNDGKSKLLYPKLYLINERK